MPLFCLTPEQSRKSYAKSFARLTTGQFFRVQIGTSSYQTLYYVTKRINETTLEVVELANPNSLSTMTESDNAVTIQCPKFLYHFNDTDCVDLVFFSNKESITEAQLNYDHVPSYINNDSDSDSDSE